MRGTKTVSQSLFYTLVAEYAGQREAVSTLRCTPWEHDQAPEGKLPGIYKKTERAKPILHEKSILGKYSHNFQNNPHLHLKKNIQGNTNMNLKTLLNNETLKITKTNTS